MSTSDAATRLSLDYLHAIENRLEITWDDEATPICVHDRITEGSLISLRHELHDLLHNSRDESLHATIEFSKHNIQTVGFGLAPNFDLFVKLGFLCGRRLVLWDMIGSRLLSHKSFNSDRVSGIAAAACNLLLLRPIVEQGGLVILPHPTTWSEFARLVAIDLKEQGNKSLASFGLSMTLSTVEDGLILHPYTLLRDGEKFLPHTAVMDSSNEFYSKGNYTFHEGASKLLLDQRFTFLRRISAKDFYQIITQHGDFNGELGKFFSQSRNGISEQQTKLEANRAIDKLSDLLEKRNKDLLKYIAEGSEATLGVLIAHLIALSSGRLDEKDALFYFVLSDLSVKLFTALRKWYSKPQKPVLIQTFEMMKNNS
jgi:hypothetical protein